MNIGIDMDNTICSTSEKNTRISRKIYNTRKNKQ